MVFCNDRQYIPFLWAVCSHNPYFNRWFSAISFMGLTRLMLLVTILILIDGFLQYLIDLDEIEDEDTVTILILIDGFLQ